MINYIKISPEDDLTNVVKILNKSHKTVAKEFGFTFSNNPSNNAFVDAETLRAQLKKGIELYVMMKGETSVGCIAVEKSPNKKEMFYIEKVSILPDHRQKGYGEQMMKFAEEKIREKRGKKVSVALIDHNYRLKHWYELQGYVETSVRDFPHLPFNVCFMEKKLK